MKKEGFIFEIIQEGNDVSTNKNPANTAFIPTQHVTGIRYTH